MCVAFLALDRHPRWRVVLATNRDETYARQTAPAGPWRDCPSVIGGRDLEAGGTWLGVTESLRWSLVTNVRDLPAHRRNAASRGDLPTRFLCSDGSPEDYAQEAFRERQAYNPFNLLVGSGTDVWYASTHHEAPEPLASGIYGLSNAVLDTPWPKVTRGKRSLERALTDTDLAPDVLFALLDDSEPAPLADLPDTGVGTAWEQTLSPIFIASPDYGTRAQSVLLLDARGRGVFAERTTGPEASSETRAFALDSNRDASTS